MTTFWTVYIIIAWAIRVCMVPVTLRRQFTPGTSIAWLGIIFLHPYIGLFLYVLVGERPLGPSRSARHRELAEHYRGAALQAGSGEDAPSQWICPACAPLILQARKVGRLPVVMGNHVEFLGDSKEMAERLVADINAAAAQAHLAYYIFAPDETGKRVAGALMAAAGRGVSCRLLADAFASRCIFGRRGLVAELRRAKVTVTAALPPASLALGRRDLRLHRKVAIIDNKIAYAGSQNIINADYGGRRGGPWVDLTGRFTGPIVGQLSLVFAEDWAFDTGVKLSAGSPPDASPACGEIPMQVVPTGPADPRESYRRVFLGAVQSAKHQLILTTPYFVPDEPTLVALMMAADRGVEVSLIVPLRPDHFFTAMAGRAHFSPLLLAGVRIFLYRPGLIHAKTVTVDDLLAIVGSANLDVRSFNLNFELSTLLYGSEVTAQVRAIQMQYIADSTPIDPAEWSKRSAVTKYADRAVALLSPLL